MQRHPFSTEAVVVLPERLQLHLDIAAWGTRISPRDGA